MSPRVSHPDPQHPPRASPGPGHRGLERALVGRKRAKRLDAAAHIALLCNKACVQLDTGVTVLRPIMAKGMAKAARISAPNDLIRRPPEDVGRAQLRMDLILDFDPSGQQARGKRDS